MSTESTPPIPAADAAELLDAPPETAPVLITAAVALPTTERPADEWSHGRVSVGTTPQMIAGALPSRRALVLDFGQGTVFLARSRETCTLTSGFPTSYAEITHRQEVWAVSASGTAEGSWAMEYDL